MRDSVRTNWIVFTESFEGGVASPYLDVRQKMTIAYGNLVDSPSLFSALPLVHADGRPATTSEKVACYETMKDPKNAPGLAHGGWRAAARLTDLRLSRDDMTALAMKRLGMNESAARILFPDWEEYSANAQMALHSLFWACGPAVHFPKLFDLVRLHREWGTYTENPDKTVTLTGAAKEIQMATVTPEGVKNEGLIPRNTANGILMANAQRVDDYKLDPELLVWTALIGTADDDTVPNAAMGTIYAGSPPPDPDDAA